MSDLDARAALRALQRTDFAAVSAEDLAALRLAVNAEHARRVGRGSGPAPGPSRVLVFVDTRWTVADDQAAQIEETTTIESAPRRGILADLAEAMREDRGVAPGLFLQPAQTWDAPRALGPITITGDEPDPWPEPTWREDQDHA